MLLAFALAGGLIVYCCSQRRLQQDINFLRQQQEKLTKENDDYANSIRQLKERNASLQEEEEIWKHKTEEAHAAYQVLSEQNSQYQTNLAANEQKLIGLQGMIQLQQSRLDTDISALRASKMEQLQQELEKAKKESATAIFVAQQNAQSQIDNYTKQADAARAKYFSIIEVLRQNENDEENHKLHISEQARADIEYLLNAVALRLNNPNIIYKLIWSEYIQSPTNDLLNQILPDKDCSGIYKITNCEDKRCYIGRSTSVRKRLQEHIKSAIGIENIASQRIHDVMREKGLWNFRFELLEACPKDQLGEREKYYIEFFDSQAYGYNQVSGSAYKDKGDN